MNSVARQDAMSRRFSFAALVLAASALLLSALTTWGLLAVVVAMAVCILAYRQETSRRARKTLTACMCLLGLVGLLILGAAVGTMAAVDPVSLG